jgi:hypothetical protein
MRDKASNGGVYLSGPFSLIAQERVDDGKKSRYLILIIGIIYVDAFKL